MAIYTKRGDRGETGLFSNTGEKRIPKNSLRINAIGSVDEINSYLGVCINSSPDTKTTQDLKNIQKDLFSIGAILATAEVGFDSTRVLELEKQIDEWEGLLPVLANFILSSGTECAVHLFYARTLVRKAEREIISLNTQEEVDTTILKYLNRLSDYLFMLARSINFKAGIKETLWKAK